MLIRFQKRGSKIIYCTRRRRVLKIDPRPETSKVVGNWSFRYFTENLTSIEVQWRRSFNAIITGRAFLLLFPSDKRIDKHTSEQNSVLLSAKQLDFFLLKIMEMKSFLLSLQTLARWAWIFFYFSFELCREEQNRKRKKNVLCVWRMLFFILVIRWSWFEATELKLNRTNAKFTLRKSSENGKLRSESSRKAGLEKYWAGECAVAWTTSHRTMQVVWKKSWKRTRKVLCMSWGIFLGRKITFYDESLIHSRSFHRDSADVAINKARASLDTNLHCFSFLECHSRRHLSFLVWNQLTRKIPMW